MSQYQGQSNSNEDDQITTPTGLKMSKFITWFMYAWAMFGVGVLLLRTFLLATSANMGTGFSNFIARTSADYLRPFRGIFSEAQVTDTGYLDISALFAAAAYLFLGWGFKALVDYVQDRIDRNRAEQQNYLMRQALANSAGDMDSLQVSAKGTVSPRNISSVKKPATRRKNSR